MDKGQRQSSTGTGGNIYRFMVVSSIGQRCHIQVYGNKKYDYKGATNNSLVVSSIGQGGNRKINSSGIGQVGRGSGQCNE